MSRGQAGPPGSGSVGLRTCPCHPRMLQTLKELEACSPEAKAKAKAFQLLLFLVGIFLFKVWGPGAGGHGLGALQVETGSGPGGTAAPGRVTVRFLGLTCVPSFPRSVSYPRDFAAGASSCVMGGATGTAGRVM